MIAHEDLDVRESVVTMVQTIVTHVVLGITYDPAAAVGDKPETVAAHTWTGTRLN